MAGAFIAQLGNNANTTSVATTVITIGATGAAVGDLVVAASHWGSGSQTAAVTDSKGNTWTASTSRPNGANGTSQMWWSVITSALVNTDTITVTRSGTARGAFQALSFSGSSGTSATVGDQGTGAINATGSITPSSGATATTAGADIVVGMWGGITVAGTVAAGSGYTIASPDHVQTNNSFEMSMEWKIASGAAAETATFTLPLTSPWSCIVQAFKVTGGGGGAVTVKALSALGVG